MNRNTKDLLQEYEAELRKRQLSENTIRVYLYGVTLFWQYAGEYNVEEQTLKEYQKKLKTMYRPSTVNLYSVALNRYLEWSGEESPRMKIQGNHRKKRVENVLDKEEYRVLLEYLHKKGDWKYYTLFRTLAGTGIRISELKYITTNTIRSGMTEVYNKGKCREIYLGKSLREKLTIYCEKAHIREGTVFLGNGKTPITRGAVNQKMQKIAKAAGVQKERVHPHAFRHLFAKEYMKKYKNIAELSCLLGHENVETTMIYLAGSSREYMERVSGLEL